ncbi:MAG: portal protein [Spirochaetaceae bacterium]
MDGRDIKKRVDARASERSNIDGIWNLIERFVVPFRAMMFQDKNSEGNVNWRRREIFNSTGIKANSNLAAHVHGALTNSVLKWFGFTYRQTDLRSVHEAKEWLEECEAITYTSIRESNFDLEANEIYLDLTSFGNGTMTSMPEETPTGALERTDYKTIPVDECYFDFDVNGNVINFYRVLNWTADQIVDKFGVEATPDKVFHDYTSDSRSQKRHKLCFCIYKRYENENANTFNFLSVENRPYGSKYIFWEDGSQIGPTGGHHEMPVFAPRWRRVSGSQWGFSPSMTAIWDILTLNQLEELILVAGEKVIDPTILTTKKGVFGDIDLSAGGTVVVQDIEKSMKAFESRARFDVSSLNRQELIRAIREAYYVDELQLKESPAMTAAEVHARVQLMQRLLGPTFGRLQSHFLDPLVTRQFMINFRYKKFPPMPPVVAQTGGDLQIEYLGTLAKSQRMDAAQSIERWMGTTTAMAEAYPEVLDIPNMDEVVRNMAENEGVPAKLINSRAMVDKKRRKKQQQAEAAMQLEMAERKGQAMEAQGKGAAALKEGAQNAT